MVTRLIWANVWKGDIYTLLGEVHSCVSNTTLLPLITKRKEGAFFKGKTSQWLTRELQISVESAADVPAFRSWKDSFAEGAIKFPLDTFFKTRLTTLPIMRHEFQLCRLCNILWMSAENSTRLISCQHRMASSTVDFGHSSRQRTKKPRGLYLPFGGALRREYGPGQTRWSPHKHCTASRHEGTVIQGKPAWCAERTQFTTGQFITGQNQHTKR